VDRQAEDMAVGRMSTSVSQVGWDMHEGFASLVLKMEEG